ncbi:MAG TPA: nicotinate (nicotinamide) nucleotide adenylyltransferase [Vitreimonas sp.]|nr:nicotinate (nicotinamide) nucleotide adenylyltransferase [Vitreimonas sp.]
MQIVLFGGSFDPPHLGHFQVTEQLLDQKVADEVWYVPVKQHHFGKQMNAVEHRLAMLDEVVAAHQEQWPEQVKIEPYELQQEGINYTYDTLEFVSQRSPEHTFSFVIGSDNLAGFHRWLAVHEMLLKYRFYVYPREGFPMEPLYENMVPLNTFPSVRVSSTEIRERLSSFQSISELVLPAVDQYIRDHQLYVSSPSTSTSNDR